MTEVLNIVNPFPGLRPFFYNEGRYFFGRNDHINAIIQKVIRQRFVAIVGSSGSGKSSLINAGVLPLICEDQNDSWKIISSRPGEDPIANLSNAIATISAGTEPDNYENQQENIAATLRNSSNGLAEVLVRVQKNKKEKLLIVIDQFEDLFRFKRSRINKSFAREYDVFIDLLVEAQKQETVPIYIIIAIRSDFLDECQVSNELNSLINDSYLPLPPMTKDDFMQVINKPAEKAGGVIDHRLEQQILADLSGKTDQLPLLQHLLNRVWEHWLNQNNYNKPVSLDNYEAVGGISNALALHADEIWEGLPDNSKLLCSKIFKTITEKGAENKNISIPASISDISYINRANVSDIITIIERFRSQGNSFFTPFHGVDLNAETIVDLAHESLMRLWPRLQKWMEEETESINMYFSLSEASKQYQRGREGLWSSPKIEQAMNWYEKNEPSFQWSQRYNGGFERTMQFLSLSQDEYYLNEEEEMEKPRRRLRRTMIFAGSFIFLVTAAVFLVLYLSNQSNTLNVPDFLTRGESVEVEPSVNADSYADEPYIADQEMPALTSEVSDGQQIITSGTSVPELTTQTQQQNIGVPDAADDPDIPVNDILNSGPVQINADIQRQLAENRSQSDLRITDAPGPVVEVISPPPPSPVPSVVPVNEEVSNTRILEAARNLAISSQEMQGDNELKALLALQSHIFNQQHDGTNYNPEIYAGLLTSVKSLYGNTYNIYKGHNESVNSLAFRPNSTIFYSASSDGSIIQWDINDESKSPKVLIRGSVILNNLAISRNAQWLAVATDGQGIKVFNPTMANPNPLQINWGSNRMIALDFHPDNEHIIFAGSDNSIVKYNITTKENQVITKTDSEIMSLSVSPDGNMIAAGTRSGQVILLREGGTPGVQVLSSEQGNDVLTVKFNRNNSYVAAGTVRGEIRILRVSDGNLLATLRGHTARIVDIDFSPDNRLIASSSFDGTINLWHVQNFNSPPVVIRDHGSWVLAVAFSSDGNRMVTGSRQETRLMSWSVNLNDMASMICDKVTRSITPAEWNRYIGNDLPYMEPCLQLSNR